MPALTDSKLRTLKAKKGLYRVADSGGLCIEVRPTGARLWRYRYRHTKKAKMIGLGEYPDVGLQDARRRRDQARDLVRRGIDPSVQRKLNRLTANEEAENTFASIAWQWFAQNEKRWTAGSVKRARRMLEKDLLPWLGPLPITEVKARALLTTLRRIESRGAQETAHRARAMAGQIFRFAVATGRAERDPSTDLRGALATYEKRHFASITEPLKMGALLRALDSYSGHFPTLCALRLAPLVFVRPGELRNAQWSEFDLDAREWRIPAERMKSRRPHVVPLSKQAVAILKEIYPLTGTGVYVFPSVRSRKRAMSENTVNGALRRLGYTTDEMTGHGFRHMASTALHEQSWSHEAIERQLAHGDRDEVSAAYNWAQYMPERKRMMQAWADYLDGLRSGSNVLPIRRSA